MWPFSRSHSGGPGPRVAVQNVDPRDAQSRVKQGAKLIDVRSQTEFRAAHAKGSRNVPSALIKQDRLGIGRDVEVVLICASGHRSGRQARRLVQLGYINVANVQGGLNAWARAGLPIKQR